MSVGETEFPHTQLRPLDINIDGGVLRSQRHNDIFFSNEDGLQESCYVFLEGTRLEQALLSSEHIVIAETGFGTGLNLAATMQLVERLGVKTHIDYISFEACPLTEDLIEKAHAPFTSVKAYSEAIRSVLPPRWPGTHYRSLLKGQIDLHLHYGLAEILMKRQAFSADIWFLDGFTPAKNADLWSADLCMQIARLSAADARLATFTVAANVRNHLAAAGFMLEKRAGFGRKRDMLTGTIPKQNRSKPESPQKVAIIGGGIAGASLCAGLHHLSIEHVLIDEAPVLASGASGNPLGLQIPRLRVVDHAMSRLSLSAFSTVLELSDAAGALLSKGVVALDMPDREATRHEKLVKQGWPSDLVCRLSSSATKTVAGMDLGMGGMHYPLAQVISPPKLVAHLAENSHVICGAKINQIQRTEKSGWTVTLSDGQYIEADHLVLAAGAGLPALLTQLNLPDLPLQVTSGQLTYFPQDNPMSELKTALNYGGYMAQDSEGRYVAGASFDRSASIGQSDEAHDHNLKLMPKLLAQKMSEKGLDGRVSLRLATTDRWPLMGTYAPGISILSALSALGLTLAPLLGHVLARQLAGKPAIIDTDTLSILDPLRFAKRAAKRS